MRAIALDGVPEAPTFKVKPGVIRRGAAPIHGDSLSRICSGSLYDADGNEVVRIRSMSVECPCNAAVTVSIEGYLVTEAE
jgi:hypothetical protein